MMMWKRWIQHGVLCGLVLGGVVAFATVASSSEGMPPITEHAKMAAWYEKEAANLRQHEKDMKAMAEEYKKNPNLAHTEPGASHKINLAQHCESLVNYYAKAAEEAELLAGGHRAMVKK
jgi:hypothetical protein